MTGPDARPKLAVWKFASCDGCQLTLLNCEDELLELAGAVEIAYFPEATRAVVEGPYDLSLVEGSVTTPDDAARIQRGAAASPGGWSPSAPARPPAASRRCATSPTSPSSAPPSTPTRVRRDAGDLHPDRRARPGGLRAARLPDRPGPAARGARGVPPAAQAADLRRERVHGVQAARQRLRHGRARHPLPGSRHPRRVRRALPVVRPRLLRLLRARRDHEHRSRWPSLLRTLHMTERDVSRVFRTFNAASPAFAEESARHDGAGASDVMTHGDGDGSSRDQCRDPGPRRGRGGDAHPIARR